MQNRIIYSTNSEFKYEDDEKNEYEKILPSQQNLKLHIKRHKAGKSTVVIKNFKGSNEELKSLCKILKKKCSTGGTVKEGNIIIQGNIREKIINILNKNGYNFKVVGN